MKNKPFDFFPILQSRFEDFFRSVKYYIDAI